MLCIFGMLFILRFSPGYDILKFLLPWLGVGGSFWDFCMDFSLIIALAPQTKEPGWGFCHYELCPVQSYVWRPANDHPWAVVPSGLNGPNMNQSSIITPYVTLLPYVPTLKGKPWQSWGSLGSNVISYSVSYNPQKVLVFSFLHRIAIQVNGITFIWRRTGRVTTEYIWCSVAGSSSQRPCLSFSQ